MLNPVELALVVVAGLVALLVALMIGLLAVDAVLGRPRTADGWPRCGTGKSGLRVYK